MGSVFKRFCEGAKKMEEIIEVGGVFHLILCELQMFLSELNRKKDTLIFDILSFMHLTFSSSSIYFSKGLFICFNIFSKLF